MKSSTKKIGFFLSEMPLKRSLVLLISVISLLGLVGSGLVVTWTMQRMMMERVDEDLRRAVDPYGGWAHRNSSFMPNEGGLGDLNSDSPTDTADNGEGSADGHNSSPQGGRKPNDGLGAPQPPSQFFYGMITKNGTYYQMSSALDSIPEIKDISVPTDPVTVPARAGSESRAPWRVVAVYNADGTVSVVGLSLAVEQHTINRLVAAQVFVGLAVLTILVIVAFLLVRRSLTPLLDVEKTARKIAQGDLDQRVPNWNPKTEVGQLSLALNRMLSEIQGAFISVRQSAQKAKDSEEQARQSEATMRRFIGDASHELRTPLTSVRGYAELYTSGATQDADMVIGKIQTEAGRMSLLVEDLLALVRMEDGRQLRQDPVDLLSLSLSVIDSLRAAFPGRAMRLHNDTQGIPLVIGDSDRLHQVIGNLLTNALRHGGEEADVDIRLSSVEEEDVIQIRITDNGVGISPEDLPHLFDRFYRADVSRSRASGGSGLGLSIVKGLVEAHHGTVEVESELGVGTTFSISLPGGVDIDDVLDDVHDVPTGE